MVSTKLESDELTRHLTDLPGWKIEDGKLCKEFTFANFIEAFGFMSKVALLAESADHHPEWHNVYNRVRICLITLDANGVSEHDVNLARGIARL